LLRFPPGLTSVIIVNYNGAAFLRECLTALAAQSLPRHRYEVVVVDNASSDGSRELLAAEFPWARVVALPENRGFAGGNNAGFAVARGDAVALINNDTHADPFWLASAVASLAEGVGGVASKLVFHADPRSVNSAGLRLLADGRGADVGFRRADDGRFESPGEVFAGCGAALVLRRELAEFDERLFMYCEDLELAWNARIDGWNFVYEPSSLVRHVHCGSSGEWSAFFAFHLERNRALVNARHADPFLALWTLVGLGARIGRAVLRRRLVKAYLRAGLSVLARLPMTLADRKPRKGAPCASS